jgi:glutamate 5-kinase
MLTHLLSAGAIPAINENDAVATGAAGLGDKYIGLLREIAQMIADVLVLSQMSRAAASPYSTGGMAAKIAAARIAFATRVLNRDC